MTNRLLTFLRQCKDRVLTRDVLLHAGLSFFAEEVEVDLALMQLVRDHVIIPVPERPFTFDLGAGVRPRIAKGKWWAFCKYLILPKPSLPLPHGPWPSLQFPQVLEQTMPQFPPRLGPLLGRLL